MQLYTDGSASPNPGPGGWSVTTVDTVLAVGHADHASNNVMEGMAVLAAFEWLKGWTGRSHQAPAIIHTDSRLWVNIVMEWAPGWAMNGWRKADGKVPANLALVQSVYRASAASPGTRLRWVRGHAGIPGNELADEWAEKARVQRLGNRS